MRLLPWIGALAALAFGFGLGRATRPAAPPPPALGSTADPELSDVESFRRALDESDWLSRSSRMSAFLEHLDEENLPGALEVLEARLPWLATDELRLFMFAWSRFDAPGALAHTLTWPRLLRRNGSGAAIYAWAYRDPAAALEAMERVESGELRNFMQKRLVAGWTHGPHRDSANAYIASLPHGPLRFEYVGTLAWELSKEGPEAVIEWAEGIPESPARYKKAVFIKAANTLAALDEARTAAWLAGHLDTDYGLEGLRVLARTWAISDPGEALAWAMSLPDGEPRRRGVRVAFDTWLDRFPGDATAWLFEATPARDLDPAVRLVVSRQEAEAPRVAMDWAARIDDPALREEVQVEVARRWLGRSPAEARAWLEAQDLPERVRAAVRSGAAGQAPPRARPQRPDAARTTRGEDTLSATATP